MDKEREKVIRAKSDLKEFDYLYRKYFPKINNFVFHRVNYESDRHEIVSNVFYRAMKKLNMFRYFDSRKSSFSAWLYRIAVNEINQFYRNQKRSEKIVQMYEFNKVDGSDMGISFDLVKAKMAAFKPCANRSHPQSLMIRCEVFPMAVRSDSGIFVICDISLASSSTSYGLNE